MDVMSGSTAMNELPIWRFDTMRESYWSTNGDSVERRFGFGATP